MRSKHAISMRELQKMSAAQIRAMPGPTPIKSGDETVGLLVPAAAVDAQRIFDAETRAIELARLRTPEQNAEVAKALDEIGSGSE
jgi:hypothetical protein